MLNPYCGYGVFSLMCSLVKKDLKIIACDTDEDKISLAANCVSYPDRVQFVAENQIQEIDFITIINPVDIESIEPYILQNKPIYVLIDKNNKNYRKFINFGELCVEGNFNNYAILVSSK